MLEDVIPANLTPTFPTWPPPSGGLPITLAEMGPVPSPFTYGQDQTAAISVSTASAWPLQKATFYPHIMPPLNGGNQAQSLPAWPWPAKMEQGPLKASPTLSRIP